MFGKKCYEHVVRPLRTEIRLLSEEETQLYFEWYTSIIEERIDYLRSYSNIRLDFTSRSLIKLWDWFLKNAKIEPTPQARLDEVERVYREANSPFVREASKILSVQFSTESEYMIQDIAMYWGQVFVKNHPEIYWSYYTKPKTDVFRNSPVLLGFPNAEFPDRPGVAFCPGYMVKVQASRLFRNVAYKKDLYEIHLRWEDKLKKTDAHSIS